MSAIISSCGTYRYTLSRDIAEDRPHRVLFVGVNPSTADASMDDATVRKWTGFTSRWGTYAGFDVCNLFAFRSTDVRALARASDPIGPENNDHMLRLMREADTIVPCWGDRTKLPRELWGRIDTVKEMILDSGAPVFTLGLTKCGDPKHPLMLGYNTQLTEWAL